MSKNLARKGLQALVFLLAVTAQGAAKCPPLLSLDAKLEQMLEGELPAAWDAQRIATIFSNGFLAGNFHWRLTEAAPGPSLEILPEGSHRLNRLARALQRHSGTRLVLTPATALRAYHSSYGAYLPLENTINLIIDGIVEFNDMDDEHPQPMGMGADMVRAVIGHEREHAIIESKLLNGEVDLLHLQMEKGLAPLGDGESTYSDFLTFSEFYTWVRDNARFGALIKKYRRAREAAEAARDWDRYFDSESAANAAFKQARNVQVELLNFLNIARIEKADLARAMELGQNLVTFHLTSINGSPQYPETIGFVVIENAGAKLEMAVSFPTKTARDEMQRLFMQSGMARQQQEAAYQQEAQRRLSYFTALGDATRTRLQENIVLLAAHQTFQDALEAGEENSSLNHEHTHLLLTLNNAEVANLVGRLLKGDRNAPDEAWQRIEANTTVFRQQLNAARRAFTRNEPFQPQVASRVADTDDSPRAFVLQVTLSQLKQFLPEPHALTLDQIKVNSPAARATLSEIKKVLGEELKKIVPGATIRFVNGLAGGFLGGIELKVYLSPRVALRIATAIEEASHRTLLGAISELRYAGQ